MVVRSVLTLAELMVDMTDGMLVVGMVAPLGDVMVEWKAALLAE